MIVNPNDCHNLLRDKMVGKQKLSFANRTTDYKTWKQQVREKFIELIGVR